MPSGYSLPCARSTRWKSRRGIEVQKQLNFGQLPANLRASRRYAAGCGEMSLHGG